MARPPSRSKRRFRNLRTIRLFLTLPLGPSLIEQNRCRTLLEYRNRFCSFGSRRGEDAAHHRQEDRGSSGPKPELGTPVVRDSGGWSRLALQLQIASALVLRCASLPAAEMENLALGKPYMLEPSPNYAHCTDPGDLRQLTDGQSTAGYFWTQPSTVGWTGVRPVIITIDLGMIQPIRGASFNTAAGVAGVEWPGEITILVSNDGREFFVAGELTQFSAQERPPPREGYATHRFRTDQLKTHGRYVTFLVVPSGPFCFADEVEVFKGESEWTILPPQGQAITNAKTFFQNLEVRLAIERRIRQDARFVRELANNADIPDEARRIIIEELDAAEVELPHLPPTQPKEFRAVLPLNDLHARVFQAQARLWRARGLTPLTVWQSGLWDLLPHFASPPTRGTNGHFLRRRAPRVDVAMMQNEYRAGAFNLSWTGEQPIRVRAEIVGLPGGLNPPYITIHEVAWTDTKKGEPVAAALPLAERQGDAWGINVVPGLTRQVWLTLHPTNVPAGRHQGHVRLSADGTTVKLPLDLHVYPIRFPDQPTLHVGGWDYTDQDAQYDITPQNRDAVIRHLREHFVDSPWATAAALPHGRYDAEGNLTSAPDTAHFDRWLQRWPGARQYCVFAAVGNRCDGSAMGTPVFNRKVAAWIQFWAAHAQRRGLPPEQLSLLLVDEPGEPTQDEIILAWAHAIRAADTGVKIWEDPCHADPRAANQDMMRACDVLCPNRPAFLKASPAYREYFVRHREQGGELAFYSCSGPVRSLDPYTYHRLQAWTCWEFGARSSFFWAFGDGGGSSSWNEYAAARAGYVPFFLDATSVTPGKHMEALRDGVEDFEYLVLLTARLAEAEIAGRKGKALDRARQLLAEATHRVCHTEGADDLNWEPSKNRARADEVRREILALLSAPPFNPKAKTAPLPRGGNQEIPDSRSNQPWRGSSTSLGSSRVEAE